MRVAPTRRDAVVGAALAVLHLAFLASTLDVGFSRDESFYFNAAEQYAGWYDLLLKEPGKALSKEAVDQFFAYNGEHPALPKMLYGASWRLFGRMHDPVAEPFSRAWYFQGNPPDTLLGWFSESTAMRLPALLLASFLVFAVYLFGVEFLGRRAALFAALGWMFQPHAFWHSHFACFDVPVTAMWFLSAWAFLKSVPPPGAPRTRSHVRWALATGVMLGLALNTKHNAFFFPPLAFLWWAWTRRREWSLRLEGAGLRLRIPPVPLAFFAMLLVTPAVYYLLWPKLWHDPVGHLKWYLSFHAKHEYYWVYYFGTLYTKPPFPLPFPFVMSAMTIPGTTVLLFAAGSLRLLREWVVRAASRFAASASGLASRLPVREPGMVLFVFLNFLIPFAVIAHPKVPHFGGTKHWLHGVPFACLMAGVGFEVLLDGLKALADRLGRAFSTKGVRVAGGALALLLFVAPAAYDTLTHTADGSSYYNAFAGGRAAMGELGMQREFWGNSSYSALGWVNEELPPNSRVHFHDTTWDAVRMYWRDGLLRRDVIPVWDLGSADELLFHWHKEFTDIEAEARDDWRVDLPAFVSAPDGVPLLDAWRRETPRGKTP